MRLLVLICLSFLAIRGTGQTFPMVRYEVKDGLVQREVIALDIDPKGALWIGTKGGVSRFNGFDFTNYTTREGLLADEVKSILACRDGSVWIFHLTGISVIKEDSIRIIRYPDYIPMARGVCDSLNRVYFLGLFQDSTHLYNVQNTSMQRINHDTIRYGNLKSIAVHPTDGRIIVQSRKGCFTITNDSLITTPGFSIDNDSLIRMGFRTDGSSFYRDSDDDKILVFRERPGRESRFNLGRTISVMLMDRFDQLWIGTEGGLIKIPTVSIVNYRDENYLADVWTVMEDSRGTIWFGNLASGLSCLSESGLRKPDDRLLDAAGIIDHGKKNIYPGDIIGFNGDLLINTSRGVLAYDGIRFRKVPGIPDKAVYYSLADQQNKRMLFSVFNCGIYAWNGKDPAGPLTGRFDPQYERIESMAFDNRGRLWLGSKEGLLIFDGISSMTAAEAGIGIGGGVQCLMNDGTGNLWIGTGSGLWVYRGDSLARLDHKLVNRSIVALASWQDGRIIFGSPDGIGLFTPDPGTTAGFRNAEWLDYWNYFLCGECKPQGIFVDSKNRIWIAGSDGVARIDPSFFGRPAPAANLWIRELQFFNPEDERVIKQFHPGTGLQTASKTASVRITWDLVDLTTNHYADCIKMLEPGEPSWTLARRSRTEVFNNLKPGDYRFSIRTQDYQDNPLTVEARFRIIPRIYQTTGFQIVSGLLIISILILLTWWATRYSLRLVRARTQRERQLNNLRFRAVTNQLSPHFTHNVLSAIGSLVLTEKPSEAYLQITKFSRMLHSLLAGQDNFLVPLHQEVEFVTNYLELEELRFPDRLKYEINIDPIIDQKGLVPRMILQIPAENAVKHGLSVKEEGGVVRIEIAGSGSDGIDIRIQDNGAGRQQMSRPANGSNGRGLLIIREMLDYLSKTNGTRNTLEIVDLFSDGQPAGTRVEIRLDRNLK